MTNPSGARRTLVLLRHAKSAWPDDVPDHDRPLAPRGQRAAPVMGRWLRGAGYVPDLVVCSGSRRTRETWALVGDQLGITPRVTFDEQVYGATPAGLLGLIRRVAPDVRTLLVVGHDPAVPELARTLPDPVAVDAEVAGRMREKFPTAAVAVIEFTGPWAHLEPGCGRLAAFVTPRDLPTVEAGATA